MPSSFEVRDGTELEGPRRYVGGGNGEVDMARYDGRFIAVKAMKFFWPWTGRDKVKLKRCCSKFYRHLRDNVWLRVGLRAD